MSIYGIGVSKPIVEEDTPDFIPSFIYSPERIEVEDQIPISVDEPITTTPAVISETVTSIANDEPILSINDEVLTGHQIQQQILKQDVPEVETPDVVIPPDGGDEEPGYKPPTEAEMAAAMAEMAIYEARNAEAYKTETFTIPNTDLGAPLIFTNPQVAAIELVTLYNELNEGNNGLNTVFLPPVESNITPDMIKIAQEILEVPITGEINVIVPDQVAIDALNALNKAKAEAALRADAEAVARAEAAAQLILQAAQFQADSEKIARDTADKEKSASELSFFDKIVEYVYKTIYKT